MPTDDLGVSAQSSVLPSDLAHDPTPPGTYISIDAILCHSCVNAILEEMLQPMTGVQV